MLDFVLPPNALSQLALSTPGKGADLVNFKTKTIDPSRIIFDVPGSIAEPSIAWKDYETYGIFFNTTDLLMEHTWFDHVKFSVGQNIYSHTRHYFQEGDEVYPHIAFESDDQTGIWYDETIPAVCMSANGSRSAMFGPSSIILDRDTTISGDLTVNGTTTHVNSTTVEVADSLFKYAKDNSNDSIDSGWYAQYNGGTYAGMFRDASDNKFKLFHGLGAEPSSTVDTTDGGYTKGTLVANIEGDLTGNVTGNLTGNVTGNVTGDVTGNVTGNLGGNVSTLTTKGDILFRDTTNDNRLGIGSEGQVLKVSSSGVPEWGDESGGGVDGDYISKNEEATQTSSNNTDISMVYSTDEVSGSDRFEVNFGLELADNTASSYGLFFGKFVGSKNGRTGNNFDIVFSCSNIVRDASTSDKTIKEFNTGGGVNISTLSESVSLSTYGVTFTLTIANDRLSIKANVTSGSYSTTYLLRATSDIVSFGGHALDYGCIARTGDQNITVATAGVFYQVPFNASRPVNGDVSIDLPNNKLIVQSGVYQFNVSLDLRAYSASDQLLKVGLSVNGTVVNVGTYVTNASDKMQNVSFCILHTVSNDNRDIELFVANNSSSDNITISSGCITALKVG